MTAIDSTVSVRTFDDWAAPRHQTQPLTVLRDVVLGIEAEHFLHRLLTTPPSKEPLLSALGGYPFALRSHIENELENMEEAGITPVFVFRGLDVGKQDTTGRREAESAAQNMAAWELYDQLHPVRAVETFGNSGSIKAASLFRFLQKILHERNIDFMVAPYSACAQLAYLDKNSSRFIDAIMGSSELFLFEIDKMITRIDFEASTFSWMSRLTCQADLGKLSKDVFVDACMLSGTSFLPTFPPLENTTIYRKPFTIRDTISMMLTVGPSVTAVCAHYQDESQVQRLNYLDRYRRGRLAIKHHIILDESGIVQPLNVGSAPSDVHEFIGERLPEELYFYLSKGVVGPRVLNWLTSGEIFEAPPLDGGESAEYHDLVQRQLTPIRMETLNLLAQPISRYYHRKDLTGKYFFDEKMRKVLSHKDLSPATRDVVVKWNVQQSALESESRRLDSQPGSFHFAFAALSDETFTASTMTKRDPKRPLSTKAEILSNTLFRFLDLRGYITADHTLTKWGAALFTALSALSTADRPSLSEPVFLAIELLRLGHLNADNLFSDYIGAPLRGTATDKSSCLLVSRVACLAKLHHKPIGFTGPLSRNLLAHHSFICSVRTTLRDLIEITLVNLLLNGDGEREREDWTALGLELPFIDDHDCGLGIAVKSYLDELAANGVKATNAEVKQETKVKGQEEWFPHSVDLAGDLEMAFRLWDAVFKGAKAAGSEIRNGDKWVEVDQWLTDRR